jgi:deoxyribodipyrimidine photo-lyase
MAAIVWFRQDLRLRDHAPLRAAASEDGAVLPLFVWAPEEEGDWPPGGAARWWLHRSLGSLAAALETRGSRLILRAGPSLETIREIGGITGARSLHYQRRVEPAAQQRDREVEAALRARGWSVQAHEGGTLYPVSRLRSMQGGPYKVFTPFWKAIQAQHEPADPQSAPRRLAAPARWSRSLDLDDLGLQPFPDWAGGLAAAWEPGEAGAAKALKRFLERGLAGYSEGRDRPDLDGVSRLSPYLHHGELSPRQVWHALRQCAEEQPELAVAAEAFLRQLAWREFARQLLAHFPDTPLQNLNARFDAFPWRRDTTALRAWQRGRTGYPVVDAGMRELWATGFMHNRVRMIAASLLVKHLLLPWQQGARWFWDTLVDADLANNTLGWQWVAGSGADAAPYFRIFNPVLQGRRFDPDGLYVRRWVPELAKLPAAHIHAPWEAPAAVLSAAGITLGRTYPRPVVGLAEGRDRALAAYQSLMRGGD